MQEGSVARRGAAPELALVVPFHNEERLLPGLVAALRAQTAARDVPVVFVDNGSTDRSRERLRACPELRGGEWLCLEEPRVGKVHAVRAGTAFCARELGVEHVALLDADSRPEDPGWLRTGVELAAGAGGRLGYTCSPLAYFGFDALPVFRRAFGAYERVQGFLITRVGWTANGQGFVCAVEVLEEYLRRADVTTEFDVRCSLLALARGRVGRLNPGVLATSGRRVVVNARNFAAWCFYEREFYSEKDINAAHKLDLDAPEPVVDLRLDQVERFFRRRALKLASRHLMPLALFDPSGHYVERMEAVLGLDVAAQLAPETRAFAGSEAHLFTGGFEAMIRAIERDPATRALAESIARAMGREEVAGQLAPHHALALDPDAGGRVRSIGT